MGALGGFQAEEVTDRTLDMANWTGAGAGVLREACEGCRGV